MNVDQLVSDAFREQAADSVPAPPYFAERVLAVRRRRRARRLACAAAAAVVAIAVAVGVPRLGGGGQEVRPASEVNRTNVIAHPDQSPPRDLVAAGDTALAAYYVRHRFAVSADTAVNGRVYSLLDQKTGRYVKATRWSYVDVAPGMRTAAVLERELPTRRIGLLDLLTGRIERWIPVDHPVASVAFSADGRKLVATTYTENPDLVHKLDYDADGDGTNDWGTDFGDSGRTGFSIVDVASGTSSWSEVTDRSDLNAREDFSFGRDGRSVYAGVTTAPGTRFYDLHGDRTAAPPEEAHLDGFVEARLSPNGRLAAGGFVGGAKTTASEITDARSGRRVATVHGQQLLAWADDERLIAWDIAPGANEFRNRLVLVTIGSDTVVPLSGFRQGGDGAAGRWTPLFARR